MTRKPAQSTTSRVGRQLALTVGLSLIVSAALAQSPTPEPHDAEGYYQRGLASARSARDDDAIADFRKAIELDPKRYEFRQSLDDVLSKHGQWDQVIASWDQFIALSPETARAYCERGGAYSHKRDLQHSYADADRACSLGYQPCCAIAARLRPAARANSSAGGATHSTPATPPTASPLSRQNTSARNPPAHLPGKISAFSKWVHDIWWIAAVAVFLWNVLTGKISLRRRPPLTYDPGAVTQWVVPAELNAELPRRVVSTTGLKVEMVVGTIFSLAAAVISAGMAIAVGIELLERGYHLIGGLSAAVLLALSLWLITMPFRIGASNKKLLEWGTAAPALVTRAVCNGRYRILWYEFQEPSGNIIKNFERTARAPEGAVLTVMYDPNRPVRNCLYPDAEHRVVEPTR